MNQMLVLAGIYESCCPPGLPLRHQVCFYFESIDQESSFHDSEFY